MSQHVDGLARLKYSCVHHGRISYMPPRLPFIVGNINLLNGVKLSFDALFNIQLHDPRTKHAHRNDDPAALQHTKVGASTEDIFRIGCDG